MSRIYHRSALRRALGAIAGASLLAMGACASQWTVVHQSGSGSPLIGHTQLDVRFVQDGLSVEGVPVATFASERDAYRSLTSGAPPISWDSLRTALENATLRGLEHELGDDFTVRRQGPEASDALQVEVRWVRVNLGHPGRVAEDAAVQAQIRFRSRGLVADEGSVAVSATPTIYTLEAIARLEECGEELGGVIGDYFEDAQE